MTNPRSLKELVLLDLQRAQRLVRKIDDPGGIDPQFRIASPEGDYWIAMQLSNEPHRREHQMRMIGIFMAWKLSPGFTLASETITPDAVYCFGASHKEELAAMTVIQQKPLAFGPVRWLAPEQIGDDMRDLLPKGALTLDVAMIEKLKFWFGPEGKFPAVKIETGELGL